MPSAAWRHRCQFPRRLRRSPGPSIVPVVSLGADPVFSGERFLLPQSRSAQGLFREKFKILWPSTGHLLFIPRARLLSTTPCTGCPQELGMIYGPRPTSSARRRVSEVGTPGWQRQLSKEGTPDDARSCSAAPREPGTADRSQGAEPVPASHDHCGGRPRKRHRRGRRRCHPAWIRACHVRAAKLDKQQQRFWLG
jgi:hypothetical protein